MIGSGSVVTSRTLTGDLRTHGGALTDLRGADEICQAAAEEGLSPQAITSLGCHHLIKMRGTGCPLAFITVT